MAVGERAAEEVRGGTGSRVEVCPQGNCKNVLFDRHSQDIVSEGVARCSLFDTCEGRKNYPQIGRFVLGIS